MARRAAGRPAGVGGRGPAGRRRRAGPVPALGRRGHSWPGTRIQVACPSRQRRAGLSGSASPRAPAQCRFPAPPCLRAQPLRRRGSARRWRRARARPGRAVRARPRREHTRGAGVHGIAAVARLRHRPHTDRLGRASQGRASGAARRAKKTNGSPGPPVLPSGGGGGAIGSCQTTGTRDLIGETPLGRAGPGAAEDAARKGYGASLSGPAGAGPEPAARRDSFSTCYCSRPRSGPAVAAVTVKDGGQVPGRVTAGLRLDRGRPVPRRPAA